MENTIIIEGVDFVETMKWMYKPAKPGGAHLLPLFRNRALGVSVHMGYK